jgi:hypothetical protein
MRHRLLSRAFRSLFIGLAVAVVLVNAACSSRDVPQPSTQQTSDLRAPGTVLILRCSSPLQSDSLTLTLAALSVDDGREVAGQTVQLAEGSSPSIVCDDESYPPAPVLRQLFNRDYTQMAGRVRGPGDEGELATAFDLRTGAQVGPGSNPDTFAASPRDGRPVFRDEKLWYVDRTEHLRSRVAAQAPEAAEDNGPAANSRMILADGGPWYGDDAYTAVVHPSDRYAAEVDGYFGNLRVRERDTDESDAVVLSEGTSAGAPEPPTGSAPVPACSPNFWLDDRTLICSGDSNILKLTLAPGLGSVTKAELLLPSTDRGGYGPILSPDKQAFAFLSRQGDTISVYHQSLSSGAHPTKIADVPTAIPGLEYVLAWH